MKLQRWLPLLALVSVAACDRADVTAPSTTAQHDLVCTVDSYPSTCKPEQSISLVGARDSYIYTGGTVGVVLTSVNASKFNAATKVQLYINGATRPVNYNQGSVVSFIEHFGWHWINLNLAGFQSDTIGVTPPPPPPVLFTAMFRDFNHDGQGDAMFFFPASDLVKAGLKVGSLNNIRLVAFGAGIVGTVTGSTTSFASDTIGVTPPPPPPPGY